MSHDSRQSPTIPRRIRERDAASYIGLTASYLRAARGGRGTPGPPYIRIGRAIVYNVDDLDAWLLKHRITPREKRRGRRR